MNNYKLIKETHPNLKAGDKFEIIESPNSKLKGLICEFIEWSLPRSSLVRCKIIKTNKYFYIGQPIKNHIYYISLERSQISTDKNKKIYSHKC